jgi:hypothetical protein
MTTSCAGSAGATPAVTSQRANKRKFALSQQALTETVREVGRARGFDIGCAPTYSATLC